MDVYTSEFKFIDLDPTEVARQVTLLEFDLFLQIRPREFVDLSWTKDDKETRAPGILKMAQFSNHIIHWLTSEIVVVKDSLKARVAVYEKIVLLAQVSLFWSLSQGLESLWIMTKPSFV